MTIKQNGKRVPFQVGDKVRRISGKLTLSVVWVSRNAKTRGEQMIRTSDNAYTGSGSDADLYIEAA